MDDEKINSIRKILLNDWDPIGLSDKSAGRYEYDHYVHHIHSMLRAGSSEGKLADYLHECTTKDIGLFEGVFYRKRNLKIARKLLTIEVK
jgi:hypothetical protein